MFQENKYLNNHEDYMSQAINLAKKGLGSVSPNPLVGCVIVKGGRVIGEGFHEVFGGDHAEISALKNCIESPSGASLYVNLEPCSVYGKTPPCVKSIIESSISEVYIGTRDYNPDVNGSGIIDLEKESIVLLINALETIGDRYGIYGFSGYGRENVEYYVIKDLEEQFNERIKRRSDKVSPLHATRMGTAIRHAVSKLAKQDSRTKVLFLISDGRPQDRGYSREGVEKEYAVHDTRMALIEARHKGITPFCLTVDKSGHDYLKTMCQDMGYEILDDISSLPTRLPTLYRKLTF